MQIFIIVAAVIIAAVIQIILQHRQTGALICDVYPDTDHAEPDEKFNIIIKMENPSWMIYPFVRFGVLVPNTLNVFSDMKTVNHPPASVAVTGSVFLLPKRSVSLKLELSAPERGCYRFGHYYIETGDFLGFKEFRKEFIRFNSVAVFPRPLDEAKVSKTLGGILGDFSVRRFIYEDPVLIRGFREYTGREPMRSISWVQSAREGQLMVKEYDHTSEVSVSVLLDSEGSSELAETCFSLARSVCDALENIGIEYDFFMNSTIGGANCRQHYFATGMGHRHSIGILRQLAMAVCGCDFSGSELIERVRGGRKTAPGIIFITGERNSRSEQNVARLAEDPSVSVCTLYAEDYLKEAV